MDQLKNNVNSFKHFLVLLFFIALTDIFFLFNIPVLRQITGFIFLTFIPGLMFIYILKLHKLKITEKLVISIGLSISSAMLVGLLINSVFPLFGYMTPLSSNSVLISFNIFVIILSVVAYLRNRISFSFNLDNFKLNTKEKAYLLLPCIFPFLATFGMLIMNTTSNNAILILFLIMIVGYIIFLIIKHNVLPIRIYTPAIMLIGLSVILLEALRSNHIIGADIHTEYYIFQQTLLNGRWLIRTTSPLDGCISVSILPTVYQSFLNMNSEYLFKILYAVLFSISPLIVYLISRKYLNPHYSFLAVVFFMSQYYFLDGESSPRTVIALLFFGLSMLMLLNNGMNNFNRYLLFGIFSTSVILSHYSTSYIFLFVMVFSLIIEIIVKRVSKAVKIPKLIHEAADQGNTLSDENSYNRYRINVGIIIFYCIILFIWYALVSKATYKSTFDFFSRTLNSIQNIFDLESRGSSAIIFGSGLSSASAPRLITFFVSWLVIIFVGIGILRIIVQYRKTTTIHPNNRKNKDITPDFLIQKFESEYVIISFALAFIMGIAVVIPFILVGYDMERVFIQTMFILSPFFIIGGVTIANVFSKRIRQYMAYFIILLALLIYFMCNTGVTYQLLGDPQVMTLASSGQDYNEMYVHDQETAAAKWISVYANKSDTVFSDFYGTMKLVSQGGLLSTNYAGQFIQYNQPSPNGYFFLSYFGSVNSKVWDANIQWHYISNYQDYFNGRNVLYSDSGSMVFR
jgi:uncharacterized membrane protein